MNKFFEELYGEKLEDTMGDAEYIGCLIYDFAELLSSKYYGTDDIKKRSHIGFGLYTLKDLVDIVENKEGIDLDIMDSINKIKFYNDANAVKLIKQEIGVE